MQIILAKYGLAAHLALLAVAPLLLFPYLSDVAVAKVLLWLSLPAVTWIVSSPSVRHDEMPHDARSRCWRHICGDPLLWVMLIVIVYNGLRAMNVGISRAYDPEKAEWYLSPAAIGWFSGSVGDAGMLPFAAAVAFMVVAIGIRHALGGAARMAFLFVLSILSGIAAVVVLLEAQDVSTLVHGELVRGIFANHLIGTAFALCMLCAVVALVSAFDRKWSRIVPLCVLAIGGNAAGCMAFSSIALLVVSSTALLALVGYAFGCLRGRMSGSGEYKYLVTVAIAVFVGSMLAFLLVPQEMVAERLEQLAAGRLFDDGFVHTRSVLSRAVVRSWLSHAWLGVGCGATPLAIEFGATETDWQVIPAGVTSISNGWLQELAEVGIVGMVALLLPFGLLAFAFVRRFMARARSVLPLSPSCWLAIAALAVTCAVGLVDASPFRAETIVLFGAVCAVSVNSIPTDR